MWLAGTLQLKLGSAVIAWAWVFGVAACVFFALALYHWKFLPRPSADVVRDHSTRIGAGYFAVFGEFFRKKNIAAILSFLLLYRFAEAQLLKMVPPFLLDASTAGGLGLSTQQVGIIYGTIGIIALMLGGLAGGLAISRFGLKQLLWPMILSMYVPNVVFIFLALTQPANLSIIGAALAVEQFGYGFGFSAYMLYMMLVAEGEHRTAHYAICTGFMALGMMLPGMAAGWLQDQLGYVKFFVWVCVATIPSFIATAMIKVDPTFGRKTV